MPTYEYRCPEGHEFEHFYRKMSDAASELPCPECGKAAARQLSGGAGLVFKGSGFYLTDYGKNAHRKGGGSGSGTSGNSSGGEGGSKSESSGGSSRESKSDTGGDKPKSESKAESKPVESKSSDTKAVKPSSGSSSASSSKTDK